MPTELVLPDFLDTAAITVGALTGAMHATRKNLAVVGVFFVAFCTGVGGGLIRDLLLQNGIPALFTHPMFQLYATVGALIALLFARWAVKLMPAYEALDTFMIGAWVLLGCSKAEEVGLTPIPVIFIGTIAAVGGMLLRDVLCHDPPEMMRPGLFYTIAAFGSAAVFAGLQGLGFAIIVCQIATMVTAIAIRVVSVHFNIKSPGAFDMTEKVFQVLHLSRQPSVQKSQS